MKHIRDLRGATLQWLPEKGRTRAYVLRAAGEVLGTLRWGRLFSFRADAECMDGRWVFGRKGFFWYKAVAMTPDSDAVVGTLQQQFFGGGKLRVMTGRTYDWRSEDFWGWKWRFMDESGRAIVRLERTAFFTLKSDVHVDWDSMWQQDIPLLVHLGWYLMIMTVHRRRAG